MIDRVLVAIPSLFCLLSPAAPSAVFGNSARDDKPAHIGAWAKTDGEARIEFVDKESMKIAPHGDPAVIAIACKYTLDKDGRVSAEIKDFEGKNELKEQIKQLLPVGTRFKFMLSVDKTSAFLDSFEGDDVERLRAHLEGKYEWKN